MARVQEQLVQFVATVVEQPEHELVPVTELVVLVAEQLEPASVVAVLLVELELVLVVVPTVLVAVLLAELELVLVVVPTVLVVVQLAELELVPVVDSVNLIVEHELVLAG